MPMERRALAGSHGLIPATSSNFPREFSMFSMMSRKPLTPTELAAVRARREQGRANSAIEGLTLTPVQETMFEQFDAEALSFPDRRQRIMIYLGVARRARAE